MNKVFSAQDVLLQKPFMVEYDLCLGFFLA